MIVTLLFGFCFNKIVNLIGFMLTDMSYNYCAYYFVLICAG